MNPSAGPGPLRTPPPGSACSSQTTTSQPASARTLAATRPLGPAPMTTASGAPAPLLAVMPADYPRAARVPARLSAAHLPRTGTGRRDAGAALPRDLDQPEAASLPSDIVR